MITINVLQVIINHVKVVTCMSHTMSHIVHKTISLHCPSSKMFHKLLIDLVFSAFFPVLFSFLILFLQVLQFFLHHLYVLESLIFCKPLKSSWTIWWNVVTSNNFWHSYSRKDILDLLYCCCCVSLMQFLNFQISAV